MLIKSLGRCKEEGKIIKACKFMEKVFDVSTMEISIPQIKEISSESEFKKATAGEFENYSLSFIQYLEIVAHHAVLLQ
jgi:hypothetical protein